MIFSSFAVFVTFVVKVCFLFLLRLCPRCVIRVAAVTKEFGYRTAEALVVRKNRRPPFD